MAKKKAEPKVVIHNFVAKHMHEVNQSQVFVDRKKNAKRGYDKHKKGDIQMIISLFNVRSLGLKTFKPSRYVLRI
ncbi:hypothetical protein LZ086_10750 [Acinetobacter johnsonii]|nr:hypothetical protein LZ086_10750 [Acinetobacter johnsonii]